MKAPEKEVSSLQCKADLLIKKVFPLDIKYLFFLIMSQSISSWINMYARPTHPSMIFCNYAFCNVTSWNEYYGLQIYRYYAKNYWDQKCEKNSHIQRRECFLPCFTAFQTPVFSVAWLRKRKQIRTRMDSFFIPGNFSRPRKLRQYLEISETTQETKSADRILD